MFYAYAQRNVPFLFQPHHANANCLCLCSMHIMTTLLKTECHPPLLACFRGIFSSDRGVQGRKGGRTKGRREEGGGRREEGGGRREEGGGRREEEGDGGRPKLHRLLPRSSPKRWRGAVSCGGNNAAISSGVAFPNCYPLKLKPFKLTHFHRSISFPISNPSNASRPPSPSGCGCGRGCDDCCRCCCCCWSRYCVPEDPIFSCH